MKSPPAASRKDSDFLNASGPVARLLRDLDWSKSPMGLPENWSKSLQITTNLVLNSRFPMYLIWGEQYAFIYNDAYLPMIGIKHPQALGQPMEKAWPEIWPELTAMFKTVESGESIYMEDHPMVVERSGKPEEKFFTFSFSAVADDDGVNRGILCSCFETTARVLSEQRANITRTIFENNVDEAPAILWITDPTGSCTYLSKQWFEYTGQNLIQALGFGWMDQVHPEDRKKCADIFRNANEKQIPFVMECRFRNSRGEYRWAIDAGNPRFNGSGKFVGFAGSVIDIEDRKTAQSSLILEQDKFAKIFEEAPAAMVLWSGKEMRFEKVNPLYQKIFGDRDLIGKPIIEALPELKGQAFPALLDKVFETGEPFVGSEMLAKLQVSKDGPIEDHYFDFTFLRINNPDGSPYGVLDHAVDVTDRVHARQRLEMAAENLRASREEAIQAKNEAERANELKSAFLANMSHEIRTPLGAMMGFAELLRDPGLSNEERSSYIDVLFRNGESLSVIINDILDLSKVEAGHLTLEYTDINPRQIVADVVSLYRVKAREKDLVLEYSIDEETPKSIVSDPTRVRQILLNIVGNALKFTQMGKIKIHISNCKTDSGRDAICFEVKDTGIGIAEEQRKQVFEMFVQADGTMTRRFGGTGLGLALSRRLARAMGGDVTITESNLGSGTTFLIKIEDQPSRRATVKVPRTEGKPARVVFKKGEKILAGIRVLVVDDSPDNRQLIWHHLTKQGAIVEAAENGYLGYRAALTGPFDIVLMDLQMPVMDGYTATAKLRENGYKKPIIALTAHAMSDVRAKVLAVGCTDHLPKPINPEELFTRIYEYVHPENS